jgi:hypothetical protein
MTPEERIAVMEAKQRALTRRIAKLEGQLAPKKEPKQRKSKYVPKLKGRLTDRASMHAHIDEKYSKRALKNKAA